MTLPDLLPRLSFLQLAYGPYQARSLTVPAPAAATRGGKAYRPLPAIWKTAQLLLPVREEFRTATRSTGAAAHGHAFGVGRPGISALPDHRLGAKDQTRPAPAILKSCFTYCSHACPFA